MDAQEHRSANLTEFAIYGTPRDSGHALRGMGFDKCAVDTDFEDLKTVTRERSGFIHAKSDTAARCGVAIKNGSIMIEDKIGYQSGFMAYEGKIIALAKACGKSSLHDLEVAELRALSLETSAFTGVKMTGIDRAFGW